MGNNPNSITAPSKPPLSAPYPSVDVYDIRWYGATGDNSTDDTAAIQAVVAIIAANSNGGTLIIPRGYVFKVTDIAIIPFSNLTITGGGAIHAVMATDLGCPIQYTGSGTIQNITIDDVQFYGIGDVTPGQQANNGAIRIDNAVNVKVTNCFFKWITATAVKTQSSNVVTISENVAQDLFSAAYNVYDASVVNVQNNRVVHSADDFISVSVEQGALTPVGGRVVIMGNIGEDCVGIQVLGAHVLTLANNVLFLAKGVGFEVSYESGFHEGYSSLYDINISGNVVSDLLNVAADGTFSPGYAFKIGSWGQAGSGTQPQFSTGSTIQIPMGYDWDYGYPTTTNTISPGHAINFVNNTVSTSLPGGTAYVSFGFDTLKDTASYAGKMITPTGFINPTITEAMLRSTTGLRIEGRLNNALIAHNNFEPGAYGIFFANLTADMSVRNVAILHNIFRYTLSAGIGTDFGSARHIGVTLEGNTFDCDPYFQAANRSGSGWSNSVAPSAVDANWMRGLSYGGNHYKNCLQTIRTANGSVISQTAPEIIHGTPVAIGYNVGNIGVGYWPLGNMAIIEDGDKTSATYGDMLNATYLADTTIPTTGTWVQGTFVRKTNATCIANVVLLGWYRLTTGSGNVSGTDWLPVSGSC